MPVKLKPIKAKNISDQVFEQIREIIYRGRLKPGQQLLPERDLAVDLNVSRTTVRNALNKLVALGLLEHKQGQGTFVRHPETINMQPLSIALATEEATLEHLLEVRIGLECNSASLAAKRADGDDIKALEEAIAEMQKETDRGHLGTDADAAFHMAIAFATKNPVQIYLMKNFYDFLSVGIKENLMHLYRNPKNIQSVMEEHKRVFLAIKRHDPETAFSNMKVHIRNVQLFFRDLDRQKPAIK